MGENHTPGDLYALDAANHAVAAFRLRGDGTLNWSETCVYTLTARS
jgi:hypothetical protein